MAEARRIPLTVVGGFLGAGKTTVVNRILGDLIDVRAAVLVNDFGSVNIDAALIAAHHGETIALTNGCVCCSIGGDLTEALIRVMSRTPAPEWIVIEASGVSDPWRIAQVGLVDPELELDGVIVLVDAATFCEHAADPLLRDTLMRQLAAADVLVINKRDLVSDAALRTLREWIAQIAPRTPILEAARADVPFEALTGLAATPLLAGNALPIEHSTRFEAAVLQCDGTFSASRLRALLARMPAGVLRAKGILATDEADAAVLQFSGRHGSLRPIELPPPGRAARVVAIGLRGALPGEALRRELSLACLRPTPGDCTLATPTSPCFPGGGEHGS